MVPHLNDISYIWTRVNVRWLLCGALAGLGAGLVVLLISALLTVLYLPREFDFPAKLVGAVLLGANALHIDSELGTLTGLAIHLGLSTFFGLVFAQFVFETSRRRFLFLLSCLAGLSVWLFWSMMFMPAFNEPMFYLMPKPVSLLLHAVFGVSFGLLIVTLRPLFMTQD